MTDDIELDKDFKAENTLHIGNPEEVIEENEPSPPIQEPILDDANPIPKPDTGLTLEQIAEILAVSDVAGFIKIYNEDVERWKDEADRLYLSRISTVRTGECEIFKDDDENDNFWARITKVCDGLIGVISTPRQDYRAMGDALEKAEKAYKKAIALRDKNQMYAKFVHDKENLYLAKQAIDHYYVFIVKAERDIAVKDNILLADTQRQIIAWAEKAKVSVDAYVRNKSQV